jgi:hypothetical protein
MFRHRFSETAVKASSDDESESIPCEGMVLEIMKIMLNIFRPAGVGSYRGRDVACAFECHRHVPAAGCWGGLSDPVLVEISRGYVRESRRDCLCEFGTCVRICCYA